MAIDTTEANLYRTGAGDAFVWGNNRALSMLQQQYDQDKLRRAKEDAELSEQVGKINYDAARNEDLPEILKRYGDIKNTFTKIRGTQDQMERIKLQSELNEKKSELSRAVNLSKQAATQLGELGKLRLTKPDELSDDFVPNYKTLNSLSVFDPKFKELSETTASTALSPKFDNIGVAKKLADASVFNIPESAVKVQNLPNGNKSFYTESGKKLDRKALEQNVVTELGSNKPLQRQLTKLYPDMPIADAVKAYTDDLYEGMRGKYDIIDRKGASVQQPDRFYEHYNYRLSHPLTTGQDVGIPQSIVIPYGKGANVQMNEYVPISISKKNFAGSPYIDLKTGKEGGKLSSSSDYEIVGVGNAPFLKRGNFKGAISQPNYANNNPDNIEKKPIIHVQQPATADRPAKDFFVPYDRLPENVKGSKQVREALSKFTPATGQTTTVKQQPASTGKKQIKGW